VILLDQAATLPVPAITMPWRGESAFGAGSGLSPEIIPTARASQDGSAAASKWKTVTQKNFAAIAALRDGWDGYSAPKIDYGLIFRADRLLADAFGDLQEASAPYIIPAADGSLQFEWKTLDYQLEFILARDGQRSFWLKNLRTSKQIESDGDGAVQLFYKWARQVAVEPAGAAVVPLPEDEAEQLFAG
jgi:hypothetical protein